jgi:hypothetical protein
MAGGYDAVTAAVNRANEAKRKEQELIRAGAAAEQERLQKQLDDLNAEISATQKRRNELLTNQGERVGLGERVGIGFGAGPLEGAKAIANSARAALLPFFTDTSKMAKGSQTDIDNLGTALEEMGKTAKELHGVQQAHRRTEEKAQGIGRSCRSPEKNPTRPDVPEVEPASRENGRLVR